ncbi:hypothetical protein ACULLL_04260 [Lysinibacillus irui]|uniref:hypothetical protein n=1 Tax=Lysinibacillus irui TaxID=2998077 RepID=UPI004043EBEA
MRKYFMGMVALLLTIVSISSFYPSASAASGYSSSVTLYSYQTSATTERVNTVGTVQTNVVNTGIYNVSYRVFREGVAVTDYVTVAPGKSSGNPTISPTQNAEYSLRIYCNSPTGTGCTANGAIIGY